MFRRVKNSLIFFAARLACRILGCVPKRMVPAAGRGLGALAYFLAGYERNCAERQLRTALGLHASPRRIRRLTRGVFNQLGTSAVELLRMLRYPEARPTVVLSQNARQTLDEALALGRGVIFITGHIGNWELMAATLARLQYPIHTVAKQSYDPRFTAMIQKAREDFGVRVIHRGDKGAATAMRRVLKNNGILGFLIDQDTDVPSVFVPFFGRPAKTPSGPAAFALRTGAPVVAGLIRRRTGNAGHCIEIMPMPPGRDVIETTARFNAVLERHIRRRPSQWVWFHRRWKSTQQTEAAA
jgi:KDO2-lipid IV(A) lauroyltransferase